MLHDTDTSPIFLKNLPAVLPSAARDLRYSSKLGAAEMDLRGSS